MPKNWKTCGHCQGSGTCKNKLKGIQMIWSFIPFPIKTSCASCLVKDGFDPSQIDLVVKCSVCKGRGYVFLHPAGAEYEQNPNQ